MLLFLSTFILFFFQFPQYVFIILLSPLGFDLLFKYILPRSIFTSLMFCIFSFCLHLAFVFTFFFLLIVLMWLFYVFFAFILVCFLHLI